MRYYFTSGWAFLLPYFAIFLFGYSFSYPTQLVTNAFVVVHVLNAVLFLGWFIFCRPPELLWKSLLFWIAIAFFFYLPGAYLEYPSDGWEHVRRIYLWQNVAEISQQSLRKSFFYLWAYSFMPPGTLSRSSLDALNAFTQLLLTIQIFRVARALGFSSVASHIQAAAFPLFFGTSIFGIRYYALSSTAFCYLGYLAALELMISATRRYLETQSRPSRTWIFCLSAALIFSVSNHFQGLLFASISAAALSVFAFLSSAQSQKTRYSRISFVIVVWLGTLLLGGLTFRLYPEIFSYFGPKYLTICATFNILHPVARIWNTYGGHGILSLLSLPFLWKRHRMLCVLTLAPFLALCFPPFFLALALLGEKHSIAYRVLFAMPTSLILVAALLAISEAVAAFLPARKKSIFVPCFAGMAVFFLSFPVTPYWYARLFFQLYRPPRELSLVELDELAAWFKTNRNPPPNCYYVTDDVTAFALATELGIQPWMERQRPWKVTKVIAHAEDLDQVYTRERKPRCGILIPDFSQLTPSPPSQIAALSGHWKLRRADISAQYSKEFLRAAEDLTTIGWRKIAIPPYYFLFERPDTRPDRVKPPL